MNKEQSFVIIAHVFAITFYQFNIFLQNKIINDLKNLKRTDLKLFNNSIYCYIIFLFVINVVLFHLLTIKKSWESIRFKKILSSKNGF